jgi:hypothetical protein
MQECRSLGYTRTQCCADASDTKVVGSKRLITAARSSCRCDSNYPECFEWPLSEATIQEDFDDMLAEIGEHINDLVTRQRGAAVGAAGGGRGGGVGGATSGGRGAGAGAAASGGRGAGAGGAAGGRGVASWARAGLAYMGLNGAGEVRPTITIDDLGTWCLGVLLVLLVF